MDREENIDFEGILADATDAQTSARYVLRLYIVSTTPKSMRAIANIRRICDRYLSGRYELEVIDLRQDPTLAEREQVIAAPTLVKTLPLPLRRFIGDLSETEHFLLALGVRSVEQADDVQQDRH